MKQQHNLLGNANKPMIRGTSVWSKPSSNYGLSENEVHVWRSTLDLSDSTWALMWESLSDEERERADRFRFHADRNRSVIGRGLLRLLLRLILRTPSDQLKFEYNEFGKPRLISQRRLDFNLSHSGEWVILAIAMDRAVGIDIEKIRPDLAVDEIASQYFSVNERNSLQRLDGDKRVKAFFSCWTLKEAYLKARGGGLSIALDSFDVSLGAGDESRLLDTRPDPADVGRWALQTLDLGRNYCAALVVEGFDWELKCFDWRAAEGIFC